MVIYLSCKYCKTIYNATLDVEASQDWSPQSCVRWYEMRVLSLPRLCAHYQTKRAFQRPKLCFHLNFSHISLTS